MTRNGLHVVLHNPRRPIMDRTREKETEVERDDRFEVYLVRLEQKE